MNGKWYSDKDSVYLIVETHRWRSDSLQEFGFNGEWPQILNKRIVYKIINNGLKNSNKGTYEGKAYNTFQLLKISKPKN